MARLAESAVVMHVRGVVQGVGFRWFIAERARELQLGGWVRNCPDGSVEISAHGDSAAVGALVEAARHGPAGAVVDDVDVRPVRPPPETDPAFTVRR